MKIAKSKLYFRFNYFFVVALFMFILVGVIYANQPITKITTNEGQKMNNLCDLPEDADVFRQYIKEKYGDEISYEQITDLEKEFGKKYENFYTDWLAKDKNTKIKYVTLGKKCTAKDGVNYLIGLSMVFNNDNKYIIHTPYWKYSPQTFLDKKRLPNFNFVFKKIVKKIVKRDAVGIMNKAQFDKYIKNTGAVIYTHKEALKEYQNGVNKFSKLPFTDTTKLNSKKAKDRMNKYAIKDSQLRNKQRKVYIYPIKYNAILRISPMAYLDIIQVVIVEFDKNNIVKKITVE